MKPDERLVLQAVTNGQSGRDVAAAVFAGDVGKVQALLARDPALASTHVPPAHYPDFRPDGQFGDLLTIAIARCDGAMAQALVKAGVSPDGAVPGQPLETAILAGQLELAKLLLDAGAKPDPSGEGARDPLRAAATAASPAAAQLLLDHRARLDRVDSTGSGPLQDAVDMDSMRVAEVLIAAGADPLAVGAGGALPVFGISEPLRLSLSEEEAARQRLIARFRKAGMPWPPPAPDAVKEAIRAGDWPMAEWRKAGAKPANEVVARTLAGEAR